MHDRSMCGQLIWVPRWMLSHRMYDTPARKYDISALRRSSSFGDHAAAAGQIPVTALISMISVVVLPLPRRPAVTKNVGRLSSSERSMMVSAAAMMMHLPA